jgi:hypothetical protein
MNEPLHVGPLHAATGGRTDVLNISVPADSFVIPADIVSGLGEGNTLAGMKIMEQMFPNSSPGKAPMARGGVPIVAAGGEFVVSPEDVAAVGQGDLEHGHKVLDAFVKKSRKQIVKTTSKLPGPHK